MCSPHAPLCASRPPHFVSVHSCVFVCSLSVDLRPTDPTAFSTSCRGECRTSLGAEKEGGNELSVNWTKLRGPSLPPRCQTRCCQTETQAYFLQVYFAVRRHARCRGARAPNVHAPTAPPEDYPISTTCSLSGRCSHGFRRPLTPNGRRIPTSPQPPNNTAHEQSKKNSQSEALLARHPTMEYIHIHHIIHMPV